MRYDISRDESKVVVYPNPLSFKILREHKVHGLAILSSQLRTLRHSFCPMHKVLAGPKRLPCSIAWLVNPVMKAGARESNAAVRQAWHLGQGQNGRCNFKCCHQPGLIENQAKSIQNAPSVSLYVPYHLSFIISQHVYTQPASLEYSRMTTHPVWSLQADFSEHTPTQRSITCRRMILTRHKCSVSLSGTNLLSIPIQASRFHRVNLT